MAELYTKEKLQEAVKVCFSISEVMRYFGDTKSGSSHGHISTKIKNLGIDTSHFCLSSTLNNNDKLLFSEVLVLNRLNGRRESSRILKRAVLESGIKYECECCSNKGEWQNQKLTLEIDHIDENRLNNNQSNLRFLCPNCHSLRGSKKSKKINVCKQCSSNYTGDSISFCSVKCYKDSRNKISTIPSKESLLEDFKKLKSFVQVGKKYDVSDNSVRKWCKKYEILEEIKNN